MSPETRTCQNCQDQFTIEIEDFAFYAKISVPAPTFCPPCRLQRRIAFRNERSLFKRTCDLCKKGIISIYPQDTPYTIYCSECWWSDSWEGSAFAADYDENESFFVQFDRLAKKVPRPATFHRRSQSSDYSNVVADSKDIYLSYSVVKSENVSYSKNIDESRSIFDCLHQTGSENCYGCVFGEKNYNSCFLIQSRNCMDSWLLYDCVGCKNCVLSWNLRNAQYVIRNVQYSKEDYAKEIEKLGLSTFSGLEKLKEEFRNCIQDQALHKFADITRSIQSTGDNLYDTKSAKEVFDSYDLENAKYGLRLFHSKDSMDATYTYAAELMYEYTNGGRMTYKTLFSLNDIESLKNVEYTEYCSSSSNLFGCAGLKSKEYCILNKQYSPEDYRVLRQRIIDQMNAQPYVDRKGRIYKYGEFFPVELSPFAYNQTLAQEHFTLSKEQAEEKGFSWQDEQQRTYAVTMPAASVPEASHEITDAVLNETIGCAHQGSCNEQCTTAFKITPSELQFYQKMALPLPRLCPNCRHYERLRQRNPLNLWERNCMCLAGSHYANTAQHFHGSQPCTNTFRTAYAPERPETVYCEQCYQAEIA